MKETGMMFKAPLVRAILSGQKTQTRRVFSAHTEKLMRTAAAAGEVSHFMDEGSMQPNDLAYVQQFSPVGQSGDRIYVRETWMDLHGTGVEHRPDPRGPLQRYAYAADTPPGSHGDAMRKDYGLKWRPCIHMPKDAARIWLEVTGVRVERLHSITEADCIAEGAPGGHGAIPGYQYSATPMEHFRHIWESTGARWDDNPWCWVIDFKRIERAASAAKGGGWR